MAGRPVGEFVLSNWLRFLFCSYIHASVDIVATPANSNKAGSQPFLWAWELPSEVAAKTKEVRHEKCISSLYRCWISSGRIVGS